MNKQSRHAEVIPIRLGVKRIGGDGLPSKTTDCWVRAFEPLVKGQEP